jgi:hypothetical protein
MNRFPLSKTVLATVLLNVLIPCVLPPAGPAALADPVEAVPPPHEKMTPIDSWSAVGRMTPGFNIGNTLDNTAQWETGWGNPPITKEYVQSLARLGFKTVRVPVAWDTFGQNGRVTPQQFRRVAEVVDWITDAGMYCVINDRSATLPVGPLIPSACSTCIDHISTARRADAAGGRSDAIACAACNQAKASRFWCEFGMRLAYAA